MLDISSTLNFLNILGHPPTAVKLVVTIWGPKSIPRGRNNLKNSLYSLFWMLLLNIVGGSLKSPFGLLWPPLILVSHNVVKFFLKLKLGETDWFCERIFEELYICFANLIRHQYQNLLILKSTHFHFFHQKVLYLVGSSPG